ncbi:NB-ARC domain-containing protein [Nonomuraea solani]|uniref:NB-ARC domain-containing protein n=1 Tax=Nonomuraea solani TaxID=1144553 RepID=UPI001358811A|nr:NB-ARC domain-containing protein [Nonomuraea solani]
MVGLVAMLVVVPAAAVLLVARLSQPRAVSQPIGPHSQPAARTPSRPYLVPRELPPAPRGFVGRLRELEWLADSVAARAAKGTTAIAIYGAPGIGKSALSITFAHHVADRFPDGQLYVHLWKASRDSIDGLRAYVIRALAQPGEEVPGNEQDRERRYRELTRDKAALILLDDVPASLDLGALRPGGHKSVLIVTCRDDPGRPDVPARELGPLSEREAFDLLRAVMGSRRVEREEKQLGELAGVCDGHPQALRVVVTAVAQRTDWTVDRITERARSLPLVTPADGAPPVRHEQAFDAVYVMLTSDEQKALRALRIFAPLVPFSPRELAAALRVDDARGGRLAASLADAGLLELLTSGSGTPTCRARDIVVRYAAYRARAENDPEPGVLLARVKRLSRQKPPAAGEYDMDLLLKKYGTFKRASEAVRGALAAAREKQDVSWEAAACIALAELNCDLGHLTAAEDHANRALTLGEAGGHARPLRCLARIEHRRHRFDAALEHVREAMRIAVAGEDRAEQVRILGEQAFVLALRDAPGDRKEAAEVIETGDRLLRDLGTEGERLRAEFGWRKGNVAFYARDYRAALSALDEAKRQAAQHGQPWFGAWIDQTRARVALRTEAFEPGARHASEGLKSFTALHHRFGAAHCYYRLGEIYLAEGRAAEAGTALRQALESFRNCGDRWIEGGVALRLAAAYRLKGMKGEAVRLQHAAFLSYRRLDGWGRTTRNAARALLRTVFTRRSRTRRSRRTTITTKRA